MSAAPEVVQPDVVGVGQFELPPHGGAFYQSVLARLHDRLKPRTYLEIGSLNGETLVLSKSHSVAIDPDFRLTARVPAAMPSLFLFNGTSDEYFATCDPRAHLGGPIDLAFLDGMHHFEFLLRDFLNTERHCHPGSIVLLHDCIPPELGMAGRDMRTVQARPNQRYPGWWTGDVWKAADLLLRHRPDLDIVAMDAPPTGLLLVRNLDPASTILATRYDALVEETRRTPDEPAFRDYVARLNVTSSEMVESLGPIVATANQPTRSSEPHPGLDFDMGRFLGT